MSATRRPHPTRTYGTRTMCRTIRPESTHLCPVTPLSRRYWSENIASAALLASVCGNRVLL